MTHQRITVWFTNGDSHVLSVDYDTNRGQPIVRRDDTGILRFGRTQDGRWFELLAAPEINVQYWGRFG